MKNRKALTYYPSNAENFEGLRSYCENIIRDIIEKINSDIEPTYVEQKEEPKNPRLGTVYYASGITQVSPPFGWDPGNSLTKDIGTGRGLWLYTDEAGTKLWKKLDT